MLVLIDSLNRGALSAYGPGAIETPNLNRFAGKAWRFDNHFVGSLPCMPARREILAGRKELMWRAWGPLEPFDARLPKILEAHGYTTGIVTDHYHYWEEAGNGYLQSFGSAELIRGHELDPWKPTAPAGGELPNWVGSIEKWRPGKGRRYYANVRDFAGEEDFFPAKVMSGAASWLRANAALGAPFFLQVESFDVHEPFHVPEPYASMYGAPREPGRFTLWPPYQNREDLELFMAATTQDELTFIRSQYAGKLTMVDRWFGELLSAFDELDLWPDTMVVVTTDHGHDLGERGSFGKQYPHYDSHASIPLLIWHPRFQGNGQAASQLTSTVDLYATILAAANVPNAAPHSRSLLPVLAGSGVSFREAILYGTFGQGICCSDGDWTLLKAPDNDRLYSYSTSIFDSLTANTLTTPVDHGYFQGGISYPQWKSPVRFPLRSQSHSDESFLFNRRDDPQQTRNLWTDDLRQRSRMLELMRSLLDDEGSPPEQYERFGL